MIRTLLLCCMVALVTALATILITKPPGTYDLLLSVWYHTVNLPYAPEVITFIPLVITSGLFLGTTLRNTVRPTKSNALARS